MKVALIFTVSIKSKQLLIGSRKKMIIKIVEIVRIDAFIFRKKKKRFRK